MTYNEIIKTLECLCGVGDSCAECAYHKKYRFAECRKQVAKDALDLITRQQTENKRLEKEVNLVSIQFQDLQERYEEAQTKIEMLKKTEIEIDDFCRRLCRMRMLNGNAIASYEDLQNYIQQEKSEAYKEFAERLKEKKQEVFTAVNDSSYAVTVYNIDNLVKEMVGEEWK